MTLKECLNLGALETRDFIQIDHQQYAWENGWNNVLQVGLYQKGPEVSEVGSTWLENLTDMRALRPFSAVELYNLGGEAAFLENTWSQDTAAIVPSAMAPAMPGAAPRRINSIPWTLDTRIILYRRDLLAKAGIDEASAFATPDAMQETLLRLQSNGVPHPLSIATSGLVLHNAASWVWGRGGHFRSADYHKITLVEPEGRLGLHDFFRMHSFIAPEGRALDYHQAEEHFFAGRAAVLFSGQWAMKSIKDRAPEVAPVVAENTGYARPPGVPFVGSTHLVIWRHALHESEAMQLIAHLTSLDVLGRIFETAGNFPARVQALNMPPISTDPDYALVSDCIRAGRGFRSARLWAGVETRINGMLDQLWLDLFANPELNLEAEIESRIGELAARLERTLLANW